jgi:hypothetical protein
VDAAQTQTRMKAAARIIFTIFMQLYSCRYILSLNLIGGLKAFLANSLHLFAQIKEKLK